MPFINEILKYDSLSIVGLEKNVGKTECLNYILYRLPLHKMKVAVTSIGIDGENKDQVTATKKPEIYLREGVYFSTAEAHYRSRRLVSELVEITNERSSLGRIVTGKVVVGGKALISGPSSGPSLKRWVKSARDLGVELTIIDGAISRLSSASPAISKAMVLSTGAAYSSNISTLVQKTRFVVEMIGLPKLEDESRDVLCDIESGVWGVDFEGNIIDFKLTSALALSSLKTDITAGMKLIYTVGALTDKLLNLVADSKNVKDVTLYSNITINANSGTITMEQDAARMPEALQMRRLLLLSNAQNKVYKPFTSDSIGILLTEYYGRNGKANERMLAYYIKGCTYRDLGDQPAALNCFNQAIDAADTSLADCDFRQLCIVHAQIAGIFRKRGLPDEALLAYEKAEQFALMSKDTLSLLNIAANKSNVMLNKGLIDEALTIKEKVAALYFEKGYPQKAAQTRVQLIKWYARKGDFSKARAAMDNYEAHSGHFTADGHVKAGKEDYYHIKGTFYLEKGDTDSAAHYFRLLRHKGKTLNNQYLASWGLTRLYRKSQDNDSLAKYALGTFLLSDSLFNQQAAQNMQNAQAMYNYARHQETAHRKEQED